MLLLFSILTCPITLYFWLSYEFGFSSVHASVRLLWRGRVSYSSLDIRAGCIKGLALHDSRNRLIYRANTICLVSSSWASLQVEVHKPYFNLLGDSSGLLHVVALLQDVGFIEEQRAAQSLQPSIQGVSSAGLDFSLIGEWHTGSDEAGHLPATCSETVQLSGQVSAFMLHIKLSDGTAEVPADFKEILGGSVHLTLAAGTSNVQTLSKTLNAGRHSSEEKRCETGWPGTAGQLGTTGIVRPRYPILCLLKSDNVLSSIRGWRTGTGILLADPILSNIHFTTEIARFALSRLHPLLGYAAQLEGTDSIRASVTPLNMHLPSEMLSLRLEPLKVRLKTKAFVRGLIELLKTVRRKEWEEAHTLEAWTSAIAADVYRSGHIVTKRMDILVGHDVQHGDGLHMFTWGQAEYKAEDTIVDMQLGLPTKTLTRLGCKDLDEDLNYFIAVKGSALNPHIDWLTATRQLIEMVAKSNLQKGLPFLKGIFRTPSEKRKSKQTVDVPPPTLPLPWQAFPEEGCSSELNSSTSGASSITASTATSTGPSQLQETRKGTLFKGSRTPDLNLPDPPGLGATSFPLKVPTWKNLPEFTE